MTKQKDNQSGSVRPPIITVLGHVDHGKTTLLDAIRKTSFVNREAGGITQSIGASTVTTKDGKDITFIDTPGHAAFSMMRSRGANMADIAILVLAADDGVKPQTQEALKYIKEAGVPFIVAITKLDKSGVTAEKAKDQLSHEEVSLEGKGGDTPVVEVSGVTGKGIDNLLETILLVSEVNEVKGDSSADLEAVVVETNKEKGGILVSVVVKNGTLSVGQEIKSKGAGGKVKALYDANKKGTKEVLPGYSAQVLGFNQLPKVGSVITSGSNVIVSNGSGKKVKDFSDNVPVVLKASSTGFIEAVELNIPEGVVIINSSVGEVNESDVFMAKASGAVVAVLDSKIPGAVKQLAKTEKVELLEFKIIYKLFEALEELVKKDKVQILGKAEVMDSFPFNKKQVAGCKVLEGRITRTDKFTLMRGESVLGKARVKSLRRGKEEIDTAKAGEEFGVILAPQLDFEKGDVILSVGS